MLTALGTATFVGLLVFFAALILTQRVARQVVEEAQGALGLAFGERLDPLAQLFLGGYRSREG